MKDLWIKFGCFITGWNYNILNTCTEASRKQLKKYTSAILILIILWAFIGFTFAERYIKAPWWGCILASLIFVIIIVQVERQIILSVGKVKTLKWLRFVLAVLMAFIGSAIIDQIIFKDDLDKKMVQIVDEQVIKQLPNRISIIESQISNNQLHIDSLREVNNKLNDEISRQPKSFITTTERTSETIKGSQGQDSTIYKVKVITTEIENPKIKSSNLNNKQLDKLDSLQNEYVQKKMNIQNELRAEISSKNGFLEELSTMIQILSESPVALVFYIILFAFLLFLELFVVLSKTLDNSSDYDLIIEHQLNQKRKNLDELIKEKK